MLAGLAIPLFRRIVALRGSLVSRGGLSLGPRVTYRQIGANIVAMIWEDHGYGLISWKQQNRFGRHTPVEFDDPDFVKLAESFSCKGIRVNNSRDLRPAREEAFAADRPCLIVVPIDYRENQLLTKRLGSIVCPI